MNNADGFALHFKSLKIFCHEGEILVNSQKFCISNFSVNNKDVFIEVFNPVLTMQLIRKSKFVLKSSSIDVILTPFWKQCDLDRFNCSNYCIEESNLCDGVKSCPQDEVDCGKNSIKSIMKNFLVVIFSLLKNFYV